MDNRTTLIERLSERVANLEKELQILGSPEGLLERLSLMEENIYTTKKVLTFTEACFYLGISESLLYKLTSTKEVPHYKPRGKMLYFNKDELDQWLMQNTVPTISAITKAVEKRESAQPYFGINRYKKRKRVTV